MEEKILFSPVAKSCFWAWELDCFREGAGSCAMGVWDSPAMLRFLAAQGIGLCSAVRSQLLALNAAHYMEWLLAGEINPQHPQLALLLLLCPCWADAEPR